MSSLQKIYTGVAQADTAFYFTVENMDALSVHAVFSNGAEPAVEFNGDLGVSGNDITTDTPYTFETGTAVRLTLDGPGSLPGGLAFDTTYYVIALDPENNILQLASSYANALAGTEITISGAGEGQVVITGFLVGNFKLQYSNFVSDRQLEDSTAPTADGNWIDIPSQGAAVAVGTVLYGSTVVDYQFLRALIESEGGNVGYSLVAYARGQGYAP
jgi:hypothetical protein